MSDLLAKQNKQHKGKGLEDVMARVLTGQDTSDISDEAWDDLLSCPISQVRQIAGPSAELANQPDLCMASRGCQDALSSRCSSPGEELSCTIIQGPQRCNCQLPEALSTRELFKSVFWAASLCVWAAHGCRGD